MPSRRRRYRRRPKPQPKKPPSNEDIKADQVRLIDADGSALGVMSKEEAVERARAAGSDLVVVAEKADPPVARILDLGKHMYEKRKKDAKQKVKSKGKDIKGVRIGLKTDEHDWNLRLRQAANFLASGHKVKVELRLRGREKQRFDMAEDKIREFVHGIPDVVQQEGAISRSGNGVSVILTKSSA